MQVSQKLGPPKIGVYLIRLEYPVVSTYDWLGFNTASNKKADILSVLDIYLSESFWRKAVFVSYSRRIFGERLTPRKLTCLLKRTISKGHFIFQQSIFMGLWHSMVFIDTGPIYGVFTYMSLKTSKCIGTSPVDMVIHPSWFAGFLNHQQ